jgi:tetratricopeptide (TPR) repeat protein
MVCSAILCLLQLDPAALVPLYRQAMTEHEQALGPRHPKVARGASDLGLYLLKIGEGTQAIVALRRALEIDRANFEENHPLVAEDRENLALALPPSQEMVTLLEEASHCSDARIAARVLSRLGNVQERSGRIDLAVTSYRKALALEEDATRLNDLALLLEPKPAEPLLRKALGMRQRDSGPRHPETAIALTNLGNVLLAQGRLAEAERLQRNALAILEAALGKDHPRLGIVCANLAEVLRAKGDSVSAKALFRRTLAIGEQAYGAGHPDVAADRENLAGYLDELGEKAAAARLRAGGK